MVTNRFHTQYLKALQVELRKAKADLTRWISLGKSLGKTGEPGWIVMRDLRETDVKILKNLIAEAKRNRPR